MTGDTPAVLWSIIAALAFGSFLLRFAFLGWIGGRDLPTWLLRHLRYTAVAFIPALVTPVAVWPSATGGSTDPGRLAAALVTLGVGYATRSVMAAMLAGAGMIFLFVWLPG
jgi:branched-subunit amino acid transport protein